MLGHRAVEGKVDWFGLSGKCCVSKHTPVRYLHCPVGLHDFRSGLYWGYIGIMESKMETAIRFRVLGFGVLVSCGCAICPKALLSMLEGLS